VEIQSLLVLLPPETRISWNLLFIHSLFCGQDELIEEPQRRETIIENIERQKELLLVNILGSELIIRAAVNAHL
jgi:hypothetical protein